MKRTNKTTINPWTTALVAAGVVSAASVALAEEAGSPVMTALQPTTISGYVNTSAILKFGGRGSYDLPGRSYDSSDKMNRVNLDVVRLTIEKGLDESSWAAGYNVSLLFGPDANSIGTTSISGAAPSDFAIRNAYVALRAPVGNGLDIKMGVWDTVIGYEVFDAGSNPNYSRSYGFFLEPITHTGVLLSYDVSEVISVSAGVADEGVTSNSINSMAADSGDFAYLGSVSLTAPESAGFLAGAMLAGGVVYTPMPAAPAFPQQNMYNFYVGGSMPLPVTGLSLGIAYDHKMGEDTTHANAVGGYLVYQATEKLKVAGRVEWANGTDGTYGPTANGFDDQYLGVTFTVDYSLWANVISRVEFRWDKDLESNSNAFGVNGNAQENAFQLALNVIYNF
ncbi:MAG: outer membrane beta-barrel protein [Verrucomicrobiales bacterium]|nr:outer membrane beta-barrel protein [Verrucomicrobiales bacterium]